MGIDITGFQRMRRQQAEKAKKEAEEKCQGPIAQSNTQTNTSAADASTPKAGSKQTTAQKKKPSGKRPEA